MAEYAISACLCAVKCRYDGKVSVNPRCKALYDSGNAILVCPEVSGGLQIPRTACEISDGKVISADGIDRTPEYTKGAQKVLKQCLEAGVKIAVLKERSPSCGSTNIYDGTFSHNLIDGQGICAKLLEENGIKVYSEETFEFCL